MHHLLKKVLNVASGYPKLIKEFVVNNDGITYALLNFSCTLSVGKYVLDISLPNDHVIDESGFGNKLSLQSGAIFYCITSFLYQVGTYATLKYGIWKMSSLSIG